MTAPDYAAAIREARASAVRAMTNCEHGHFHTVYGLYPGGDPRRFQPDQESCTAEEMENHAKACAEWDAGEGTDRGPSCATRGDGSAWTRTGFGIGTYDFDCDDPLVQQALDALLALQRVTAQAEVLQTAADRFCVGMGRETCGAPFTFIEKGKEVRRTRPVCGSHLMLADARAEADRLMRRGGDVSANGRSSNSKQRRKQVAFLRARDGDLCWLCNKPMSFPERRTNQKELATLDHVLPVYEGGKHGVGNLRLAHKRCNTLRRATEGKADPTGNEQHRFTYRGKRLHYTRYWQMFRHLMEQEAQR